MKFMGKTNVVKNTAFIACLTFILASCSEARYGYISRVKEKKAENTEAVAETETAVAAENTQDIVVSGEQGLNSLTVPEETPVIADKKTALRKDCKAQNEVSNNKVELKKVKPLTMLKEMKKVNAAKVKPDSVNESNEVSGYFKTGLILVLIGAILLFFPGPVQFIGYIVMLVGLVFIVLGLIDML